MAAASCEFFRGSCAHADIFRGEYKRTNRTKRTKILRCFPHCCPEHVNRSYCGSPVLVRVRLPVERAGRAAGRAWTRSHRDVALFAHFEEAQALQLRVGSELDAAAVFGAVQTEQSPKGVWIEGALQHSDLEQNEHVYQVNAGARWYYEWESAATKAQRFTKHVLRVYVFEQVPAPDRAESRSLRVLALATSPEFLVVSYRRAPAADGRAERRDAPQLASPDWGPLSVATSAATEPLDRRRSPRDAAAADAADALRADHCVWAARHEEALLASKHLAILYQFMMSVDALPFHESMRQWSALLYDQLEGAPPPQKLEALLQLEVDAGADAGADGGAEPLQPYEGADAVADPTARVVRVCAGILGRLVFDRATADELRRVVADCTAGLLDMRVLRSGYVKAVALLRENVDRFAGPFFASPQSQSQSQPPVAPAVPPGSTLALVTEQILTVVFQNSTYSPLRPAFIAVLAAPTVFGFQTFVAQVRAMFVASALPRGADTLIHDYTSPFDGTWDLDGNRSSVKSAATPAAGFSLGCAMHFLREWAQVSLRVTGERSVAVASSWAAIPGAIADQDAVAPTAMHLTLDGRRRVFRHFPSGLSSMIPMGSQLLGDYHGQIDSPSSFWVAFASIDDAGAAGLQWTLQFRSEVVDEATGASPSLSVQGSIEQLPRLEAEDASAPRCEQFYLSLTFTRSNSRGAADRPKPTDN